MAKYGKYATNVGEGLASLPPLFLDGSNFIAAGATKTLTPADSSSTVKLDTLGGSVVTLPAATGSGANFKFVVSVLATTASHIVKVANSVDVMQGVIVLCDTDSVGVALAFAATATQDTITLNRSTTGSVSKGEWLEVQDFASGIWTVRGTTSNTGTAVSPFSATV